MENNQGFDEREILDIISQFIRNNFLLGDKNKTLDVNVSLYETRIVDSTGVLEIVDFLEEKFGIKINDDELVPDNLDTIKKMSIFIQRKKGNVS
jgi:acyl carrier protein